VRKTVPGVRGSGGGTLVGPAAGDRMRRPAPFPAERRMIRIPRREPGGRTFFGRQEAAVELPRPYNAAVDLLGRHLASGRGDKVAYIDDTRICTYAQLGERVDRAAGVLRSIGIRREERIAIAMYDSVDWVSLFLGAIKAGIIPVAMNTL